MEKQIDQITELLQRHRLTGWLIRIISTKGRALSAMILVWSCLMLLLSDWPSWWPPMPKPVALVAEQFSGSFDKGRNFMFDRYQKDSPRVPESQPVTIVAIDEKSLAQVGQWPWPRHELATLISKIAAYQPAAIGLDIYMPEVDQTSPDQVARSVAQREPALASRLRALPSNDDLLAQRLRETPSVLGAAGFDFKTYTTSDGLRTRPLQLAAAGDGGGTVDAASTMAQVRDYPAVLASLPLLQSAAAGQAVLSVALDAGAVRRLPLLVRVGGEPVPGLAMEMLRVATGEQAIKVNLGDKGIESLAVADLTVPTQAQGEVYLHYAPQAATINRYVSAIDVLDGKVEPQALQGKLVLIGLTGFGLTDMRVTALGEHVPGIEIQAQLMESLFDQRFLLRPWWMIFIEIAGALVVGSLMIWLIPRAQHSSALGVVYKIPKASMLMSLALNAVIVGIGFYLFRARGWLFDAASFFLITSAIFAMIFAFAEASANKRKEAERNREINALIERAKTAEAGLAAERSRD